MELSQRVVNMPASPIRKLVPYATAAKKQGVIVYHLNIGDPDIKTPTVMLEKLRNWTIDPIGYAQSQGEPELIHSLLGYYHQLGFTFLEDTHIQVTIGGSEAIGMAMFAICNPGDSLLVFEPFYANYLGYARVYGVDLIPIPTSPEEGFHLPSNQTLSTALQPNTKGILYCNPNNPTGTVYTKTELDQLVAFAQEHNLYVLADEVYREFVYQGVKHVSLLEYQRELGDKAILLDSLSKRYSLCGVRLGVLITTNKRLLEGVLKIAQSRLSAGLIDQAVASALGQVPADYFSAVNQEYQSRRDLILKGLQSIPGVRVRKPEGAFYCMAELPIEDSDDFCQWVTQVVAFSWKCQEQ